jgi:N-carbamoyl-L-amino-acid hydrolase
MGLGIEFEAVGGFDPVTFDETCVKAVRDAAERLGYSHRDIISGAGHDACWINRVAPTADGHVPLRRRACRTTRPRKSRRNGRRRDVLFHAVVDAAEIAA